jgi:hypothetical protein
MATWVYSISAPVSAAAPTADGLAYQGEHTELALSYLLEEFKRLPRMEGMLSDLVDMIQGVEDLAWSVLTERSLDQVEGSGPAVGVQLDGLGRILGEPRAEKSDSVYRKFLRVRILVNNSDGKTEDLLEILDLIGSTGIYIQDLPPAHIYIQVFQTDDGDEVFRYLTEAKAAGVGLTFVYSLTNVNGCFQFSDTYATEETNGLLGFGSVYSSTGGDLTGVFS